jgi:hypothetical protein
MSDSWKSKARRIAAFAAVATVVVIASNAVAGTLRGGDSAHAVAERKVLSLLGNSWNPAHIPQLVDAQTRLPFNNVHAFCRPPRGRSGRTVSGSFTCVVRPAADHGKARLYLSYIPLPGGHVRVHWLGLAAG